MNIEITRFVLATGHDGEAVNVGLAANCYDPLRAIACRLYWNGPSSWRCGVSTIRAVAEEINRYD